MFRLHPELEEKFHQWFKALDSLHELILFFKKERNAQSAIDINTFYENTYLNDIDRILIKIRYQLYTYKDRVSSFKESEPVLKEIPFFQVNKAIQKVCMTMVELYHLLQTNRLDVLCKNKSFISKIHQLEFNSSAVMTAVYNLNQFINQKEALDQLDFLEKALIESLNLTMDSRKEILPYAYNNEQIGFELPGNSKGACLRKKTDYIEDKEDKALTLSLISIFETLKRCYVVIRKSTINNTLEEMYQQLNVLIELFTFTPYKEDVVINLLNQLYTEIESIRFSTNRESRCSKNLFDKSRAAKHQMRQACSNHALGSEFIKMITIKRIDYLKHKIKLG